MNDINESVMVEFWDENNKNFVKMFKNKIEIEELKRACKDSFNYSEDINNINLFFKDEDDDNILITHYNDLIDNAKENNTLKCLTIRLYVEISKNKESHREKNDNNTINNNNNIINDRDNNNIGINSNIQELKNKNDKLEMEIYYYKERIKKKKAYYEKIINSLKENNKIPNEFKKNDKDNDFYDKNKIIENNYNKFNESSEIKKDEKYIQYSSVIKKEEKKEENLNQIKENNDHLFINLNTNQNEIINKKLKENGKDYNLSKLDFINNKCKKCNYKSFDKVYKCVLCDNYYICDECYKKRKEFHEHNDFFEIIYPPIVKKQLNEKIQNKIKVNDRIKKFKDILNKTLFDKNGYLSVNEIKNLNNSDLKNFKQLCIDIKSFNKCPTEIFAKYQIHHINEQLNKKKPEQRNVICNNIKIFLNILNEIENIKKEK